MSEHINPNTILSEFDDRGTLLKWLKKIYNDLGDKSIDEVTLSIAGRTIWVTVKQGDSYISSNHLELAIPITPAQLKTILEGSDYISVDDNEAGTKLVVELDETMLSDVWRNTGELFTARGAQSLYDTLNAGKLNKALGAEHANTILTVDGSGNIEAARGVNSYVGSYAGEDKAGYVLTVSGDGIAYWDELTPPQSVKWCKVSISGTSMSLIGMSIAQIASALNDSYDVKLFTGTPYQRGEVYHLSNAADGNEKLTFFRATASEVKSVYFNASDTGTITTKTL